MASGFHTISNCLFNNYCRVRSAVSSLIAAEQLFPFIAPPHWNLRTESNDHASLLDECFDEIAVCLLEARDVWQDKYGSLFKQPYEHVLIHVEWVVRID